ncbi:glycosyltransferase [Vibrio viridaestus]|uniref:Glycosyltransferase n=1 Tax=Vibrio viridaestus TaxID=2487322 RepID=A0A3N9TIY9_9VIBR|nr:glycosyltransferase [Vibrio viridaestus]RQW63884.1 glycosyltransferase [Vibrio viridaestus]
MITINTSISTSAGGIEALIRSFHEIFNEKATEYYFTSNSKEIFERVDGVLYSQVGEINSGKFAKVVSKIRLYITLLFGFSFNQKIFIFHPTDLLYIPLPTILLNKIILVQTNRLDVTFTRLGRLGMFLKGRFVYKYTVYTDLDRTDYIKAFPGLKKEKINVIPRGCRIPTATTPLNISRKLVTIARINEDQKRFEQMIKVMEHLPNDYSLTIYGEGTADEVTRLKEKIASSQANITYAGGVSDVTQVLRLHSIFIMTSAYEGFGQTLIEARSQGLPIVVYDTFTAVNWVVKNGKTGFIHEFGDYQSMCSSIVTLATDEKLYNEMSSSSLKLAVETDNSVVKELWRNI